MATTVENETIPVKSGKLWPMSVEAYHLLGEAGLISKNTELLYGIVYTKMSKSPIHSAVVRRLLRLISESLPAGYFADKEQPLTCIDSEPEPDIAVIRGSEEDFWERHPRCAELVVEVCVTSHDYDRSKLRAYASAGVKECWLALVPEQTVECFSQPQDGEYTRQETRRSGEKISISTIPSCTFEVNEIFFK